MSYLAEYKKEDFTRMTWEEYNDTLEKLFTKVSKYIKKNNVKIDAVVPILRGAAVPAAYLTFKLGLLVMIPVQYKYFFEDGKIVLKKILDIPKKITLPNNPTFLLVENNLCFGLTAQTAAKDIKERFPGCKIIYASDHMDYSYQKNDYADVVFAGRLTNETKALKPKEADKKGISNNMFLFPWESLKEEWETVQGKQFQYGDIDTAKKNSENKVVLDNE